MSMQINSGKLLIKNGTVVKNDGVADYGIALFNGAELVFENVTYKTNNSKGGVYVYSGSKFNMDKDSKVITSGYSGVVVWGGTSGGAKSSAVIDGVVDAEVFAVSGNGTDRDGADITINENAKIIAHESSAIYSPNPGNLTINGGEITGADGIYARCGNITINGGTITGVWSVNDPGQGYVAKSGATNEIGNGITVDFTDGGGYAGMPTLTINGGNIVSKNGMQAVECYLTKKVDKKYVGTLITDEDNAELVQLIKENVKVNGGNFSPELREEYK